MGWYALAGCFTEDATVGSFWCVWRACLYSDVWILLAGRVCWCFCKASGHPQLSESADGQNGASTTPSRYSTEPHRHSTASCVHTRALLSANMVINPTYLAQRTRSCMDYARHGH